MDFSEDVKVKNNDGKTMKWRNFRKRLNLLRGLPTFGNHPVLIRTDWSSSGPGKSRRTTSPFSIPVLQLFFFNSPSGRVNSSSILRPEDSILLHFLVQKNQFFFNSSSGRVNQKIQFFFFNSSSRRAKRELSLLYSGTVRFIRRTIGSISTLRERVSRVSVTFSTSS